MSMLIPNLEELVATDHKYRKILKLVDFEKLTSKFKSAYSNVGRGGYPISSGFKALLLQFMEDKSDRQMEEFLKYDLSAKLFCGFGLKDETPVHSYFGALRARLGLHRLTELFKQVQKALKDQGLIREVFTFVDATDFRSRIDIWKARDVAIADSENDETDDDGNPTMNNQNMSKYTSDPDARFGCKGKNKRWIGYKNHVSVDMSHGLINKVKVTGANVHDSHAVKDICPDSGMVFGDKAYCVKRSQEAISNNNCHSAAILKNNMIGKDKNKDGWLTKVRMPFEGTFASMSKVARYRGTDKNEFQAIMQALGFNLKRLIKIQADPIPI